MCSSDLDEQSDEVDCLVLACLLDAVNLILSLSPSTYLCYLFLHARMTKIFISLWVAEDLLLMIILVGTVG